MNQIFPFQLLNCGVREIHVAPMVDKFVHLGKLFCGVIFQQMFVIFAHFNQFNRVVVQFRRFKLAVGFFTQMENSQTCSQILIVWSVTGDQVCGGLDDGFVNIRGADPIIKLDVRTQFHLRN